MTWIIVSLLCNTAHCWWMPTREKPSSSMSREPSIQEIILAGETPGWGVQGRNLNHESICLRLNPDDIEVLSRALRASARLDGVLAWLRRNANAEREPQARAAFIEAYNAALAIRENGGSYDE